MAIRFFLASNQYAAFLVQFYHKYPEHNSWSYQEHFKKQMDCYVGWGDLWQRHLTPTGQFDVMQVQVNDVHLQKKWALENKISYRPDFWMEDIFKAQVLSFKPDVYFAHDTHYIGPELRNKIIKEVGSVKKVLGWDGIAMIDPVRFDGCDIVLSCSPFIAEAYSDLGKKGYLFRYAFEPALLDHLKTEPKLHPLSFAGSLTLGKGGHNYRLEVLGALARSLPLEVWLSSFNKPDQIYFIKNLWRKCKEGHFQQVMDILRLWKRNQGEVFGLDMFQVIAQSGLTINTHIDVARNQAANIRLFEATGCGACLVTDFKDNLGDYFEDGKEVIAYKSPEECVEKVKYLLNHPAEYQSIAKAGQERTLTQYTYQKRVLEFADFLLNQI